MIDTKYLLYRTFNYIFKEYLKKFIIFIKNKNLSLILALNER